MDAATTALIVAIIGAAVAAVAALLRQGVGWVNAKRRQDEDRRIEEIAERVAARVLAVRDETRDLRVAQIVADVLDSRPITNGEGIGTLRVIAQRVGSLEERFDALRRTVDSNQRSLARQAGQIAEVQRLVSTDIREHRAELRAHRVALEQLHKAAGGE